MLRETIEVSSIKQVSIPNEDGKHKSFVLIKASDDRIFQCEIRQYKNGIFSETSKVLLMAEAEDKIDIEFREIKCGQLDMETAFNILEARSARAPSRSARVGSSMST